MEDHDWRIKNRFAHNYHESFLDLLGEVSEVRVRIKRIRDLLEDEEMGAKAEIEEELDAMEAKILQARRQIEGVLFSTVKPD